jgi:hypothetical protein
MAGENRLHRSDAVTQDQIYRAIDHIYEAALDPNLWTDLLRDIGKSIGAPQGSLMMGSRAEKTFTDFGYGRNEEAIALYNTEFRGEDPVRTACPAWRWSGCHRTGAVSDRQFREHGIL